MKIKGMLSQNRRDFRATFECEGCGFIDKGKDGRGVSGYDDRNFHDNVIPRMVCPQCGKSRIDLGIEGQRTETRYLEDYQV